MLHSYPSAPGSHLEAARRGQTAGRFCKGCREVYPMLRRVHAGKPLHGKDHIAAPCPYEGRIFEDDAPWWEKAYEVLPAPPAAAPPAT